MSILENLDLENVPDLEVLEDGEYEVRIQNAEEYTSKQSGKMSIQVLLVATEYPDSELIYHYLALPQDDDDQRKINSKKRRIKEFLAAFGLSVSQDYDEWVGATAWALLTQEVGQNGEPRNNVKNFIQPR